MKLYLSIAVLCFIYTNGGGQTVIGPGGVKGAIHWYVTDSFASVPSLRSRISDNSALLPVRNSSAAISWFNFHPSLVFTGTAQLPIDLGNVIFNNASYFTVYQPSDTSAENTIWHITKNQKTELVLTTRRMTDLSTFQYMNYKDVMPIYPKVNVYVQQKAEGSIAPVEKTWYIGTKPSSPHLPIVSFKGLIPEIIAFDRVLSGQERLQVASYLALKYGITLTEPNATYLSSAGEIIWDGWFYNSYHHNIAGIGRDDSSGWEQKIATSSNTPNLLTLSTKDVFPNNSFLLWGDNGMPLTAGERIEGLPPLLQKKWLMITYGNTRLLTTNVVVDIKQIDALVPAKPVYWLAVDRSGMGNFSLAGTEFIKMTSLDPQGRAHFNGLAWNKSRSGKESLALIASQDLLLSTFIKTPECLTQNKGSLQIKVLGGNPPFQLTVADKRGQLINQRIIIDTVSVNVTNIAAGKYFLKVSDATLQVYTDSFYVNNADAPKPLTVLPKYVLSAGEQIKINAADQMPAGLSYEWTGPDNFQSFSPHVTLTEAGVYTLTCSRGGCGNQQEVVVTTPPGNVFSNVEVYPNPSGGQFTVKIKLDEPAKVSMTIYTSDGKLIDVKQIDGFANYTVSYKLIKTGMYKLVFRSGQSTTTKKLIIVR